MILIQISCKVIALIFISAKHFIRYGAACRLCTDIHEFNHFLISTPFLNNMKLSSSVIPLNASSLFIYIYIYMYSPSKNSWINIEVMNGYKLWQLLESLGWDYSSITFIQQRLCQTAVSLGVRWVPHIKEITYQCQNIRWPLLVKGSLEINFNSSMDK